MILFLFVSIILEIIVVLVSDWLKNRQFFKKSYTVYTSS